MHNRNFEKILPYILIAPLIIVLVTIIVIPAFLSLLQSFMNITPTNLQDIHFVGVKNYLRLLGDKHVLSASKNTGIYILLCMIAEIIFGLVFALGLKSEGKYRGIILSILVIPWALPPIVNGIMWKWNFDPSYGVINDILLRVGLIDTYQVWFSNSIMAICIISFVHVWRMLPIVTLVFLAQLETIPNALYEIANIDGANRLQKLYFVTLPLIKPAFFIVFIQSVIASIQIFDEAYVLNGMASDTRTIMMENYFIAFRNMNISYGMALAISITVFTLLVTGLLIRKNQKESV